MTKKHFQALADALRGCTPDANLDREEQLYRTRQWQETCAAVSFACEDANPRFDRTRFLTACGMEE